MSKTALVTGGTDGIGREVAHGLAIAGHQVIVVGRNREKGERAVNEIKEATGNTEIKYMRADLSLISEAFRLGDEITSLYPELHYLVLGAGAVRGRRQLTAEGIESTFALNYLSRFALTRGLLPVLESAGRSNQSARIVLLSGAAQQGRIHFDDVNLTGNFSTVRSVLQFCAANDAFTAESERRRNGRPSNVAINCLKMGGQDQDLTRISVVDENPGADNLRSPAWPNSARGCGVGSELVARQGIRGSERRIIAENKSV